LVSKAGSVENLKVQPGDVILTVTVVSEAARTTALDLSGSIKLVTNHPDAEEFEIPYSARLRPLIELRPAQIRLILEKGNPLARATFLRGEHNRGKAFDITKIKPSNPDLFMAVRRDAGGQQQVHQLQVMLVEELVPGTIKNRLIESLVISTDDELIPEISIPVLIEPRQPRAQVARPLP
jgi:hypothetical protein